ncbi:MAG: MBL fold metallo-hydrolase [Ruminococcaceae bacterium]|nr:MBL fold metallo-hydrolase [Oscillospiraceae bacterium]
MNEKTLLYQITETSKFMMGFVLVTKQNNVIVVDGGRAEDMPLLKEYIGGRHISAWILTHAHGDHISGIVHEFKENGGADFDIEKIYYNMPNYDELMKKTEGEVPDLEYFRRELSNLVGFNSILPMIGDRAHVVEQGETFEVDECKIEVLYTYHDGLYSNLMNDSSVVFMLTTPNKKVLFLGDLGPEGGDVLYEESRDKLKADIVQMAHHGHMNVGMEVYAAIMPEACMWCCADWLYNEPEIPKYLLNREKLRKMQRERMYGTTVTRKWMDILGAKTHYVTKDGTNCIEL